jgi:hypothetical protein
MTSLNAKILSTLIIGAIVFFILSLIIWPLYTFIFLIFVICLVVLSVVGYGLYCLWHNLYDKFTENNKDDDGDFYPRY